MVAHPELVAAEAIRIGVADIADVIVRQLGDDCLPLKGLRCLMSSPSCVKNSAGTPTIATSPMRVALIHVLRSSP